MVRKSLLVGTGLCILVSVTASCTKKEVIYTKEDMLALAPQEGSEKVEILLARNLNDVIPCSNYGEGCLSVHRLRAKNLEFLAIEFTDGALARQAALRIRGWTVKNWLFDDVEGEPVLMRWLEQHYQGERFRPLETTEASAKTPAQSAPTSPANAP